jgi:hypothetical protein
MRLDLFACDNVWTQRRDRDAEPDLDSRALSIIKNSGRWVAGSHRKAR